MRTLDRSRRASALPSTCAIFFSLGIGTAAVGPLLPELARQNGLSIAAAGLIISLSFLGGTLSSLLAGPSSDRVGRGPVLLFGILVQSLAAFALTFARSDGAVLALAFVMGIGGGSVALSVNVLVADLYPERSVAALNLVNVFFGIGAIAGPAFVSLSVRVWHTGIPALWIASALLLSQAPFVAHLARVLASHKLREAARVPPSEHAAVDRASIGRALITSPALWTLGAALLVDVGAEQCLSGWTTLYMQRSAALTIGDAALVTAGYWIAATLGRVLAATLGARHSAVRIFAPSLAVAFVGSVIVNTSTGSVGASLAGFLLVGLGFGPIWPTIVASIGRSFARSSGAAMGVASALGGVGGVLFPWLDGLLLARVGPAASVRLYLFAIPVIAATAITVVASRRARA